MKTIPLSKKSVAQAATLELGMQITEDDIAIDYDNDVVYVRVVYETSLKDVKRALAAYAIGLA